MAATTSVNGTATAPVAVVRAFLERMEEGEVATDLLAEDAVWINVSLPTVRGRDRIARLCRFGLERGFHFRVHFHHVAADGGVVLTERSDALGFGRFEQRFWVHGRFEVRDGKITVWRDSFDYLDYTLSIVRGLAGVLSPALNRSWPPSH
jgi:limonene-1,2-epoxide hydrolase